MKQEKLIPKRRFKDFDEGWNSEVMKELASFSKGKGYSKRDLAPNGSPIILYGHLYTDYQSYIQTVKSYARKKENSVISQGNEVIVPSSGETAEDIARASAVGKSGIILAGDLNIIKPNSNLDSLFLGLNVSNSSVKKELTKRVQGSSVVHLYNSDIEEVTLSYPSLEEQQRIGQFFKHLDEMITLEQRKIDKIKALKSAYLAEMFPAEGECVPKRRFEGFTEEWKNKTLKEFRDENNRYSFTGGPFGSDLKSEDYTKSGVRIIQLQNIGDGYFSNKYKIYTSEQKAKSLSTNLIYPNEIIIAKMAEPLARAAIIPGIEPKYLMASDGIRLKVDIKKFHTYFLLTLINSEVFRNKALENSTGTTRKRIGLVTLGNLSSNIPEYKEQQKIGGFFKKLEDKIMNYQQKLDKLKATKQAYLYEMFV